jgi:hypothetical protein
MIKGIEKYDTETPNSQCQPTAQNDLEEYNHDFMDIPRVVEIMVPKYEDETLNCHHHKCKCLLVGFTVIFFLAIGILSIVLIVRSVYSSSHEQPKINWQDPS